MVRPRLFRFRGFRRLGALLPLFLLLGGCGREVQTPLPTPGPQTPAGEKQVDTHVVEAQLGSTPNLHRSGSVLLSGQPTAADLATAKADGVQTVVTLRTPGEIEWDEAAVVQELGLQYVEIPFRGAESLTDEIFDRIRQVLADSNQHPVLLHCATANRVGAVWLPFRVLDQGVDLEQATQEAEQIGLRGPEYRQRAWEYIQQHQSADNGR